MIIDAAVHPFIPSEDYTARIPRPWKDQVMGLPAPFGRLWESPIDEIADLEAASDPERTAHTVFRDGVDAAIVTPLTRGLLPNRLHASSVASVTNDWLRETWLDSPAGSRFYGSIRVAVTDPEGAAREIERWKDDERFVQIAVPLRVFAHYGAEQYIPIWEAAADAKLPVYVQDDLANAAEMCYSVVGQPVHWAETDSCRAMLSIVHLASVIGSGLYQRLPELRFVFGDGGLDLAPALLWRMDNDWRNTRIEAPWIEEPPSVVAANVARFITSQTDGRPDGYTIDEGLVELSCRGNLAIYGSHHPFWDGVSITDATEGVAGDDRQRVLRQNILDVAPRLAVALGVTLDA